MRNRPASCCVAILQPVVPVWAAQPISPAYDWHKTGADPLRCNGYQLFLSVVV